MSVRHRPCGGPVTWKSVLDDSLVPAMVPWCARCETAAGYGEIEGTFREMPEPEEEELRDHLRLRQMPLVGGNGVVH